MFCTKLALDSVFLSGWEIISCRLTHWNTKTVFRKKVHYLSAKKKVYSLILYLILHSEICHLVIVFKFYGCIRLITIGVTCIKACFLIKLLQCKEKERFNLHQLRWRSLKWNIYFKPYSYGWKLLLALYLCKYQLLCFSFEQ